MVTKFSGACYKSFPTREEAEDFLNEETLTPIRLEGDNTDAPPAKRQKTKETTEPPVNPPAKKVANGEIDDETEKAVESTVDLEETSDTLVVFTDGACTHNNQTKNLSIRRAGIGIYCPELNLEVARRLPSEFQGIKIQAANGAAEIFAILDAIFKMYEKANAGALKDYKSVLIKSDSKVSVGLCLGHRGKVLASLAKITRLAKEAFEKRHNIIMRFKWVKGHNGDPGNSRADALAKQGCSMEED